MQRLRRDWWRQVFVHVIPYIIVRRGGAHGWGFRRHLFIHCHKEKVVGNVSDLGPNAGRRRYPPSSCSPRSGSRRQPWCSGEQSATGSRGRRALCAPCPLSLESPRCQERRKAPVLLHPHPGLRHPAPRPLSAGQSSRGLVPEFSLGGWVRGWSHRTRPGKHRPEAPRSAAEGEGQEGSDDRGSGCWRARGGTPWRNDARGGQTRGRRRAESSPLLHDAGGGSSASPRGFEHE